MISAFFPCLPQQTLTYSGDAYFFDKALKEAQRGLGTTHPNPSVGALVVQDNTILSSGFTKPAGGLHAEKNALLNLYPNPTNATLYVTLEPCSHHGRTSPCTDAIIRSGIKRVIYGCLDPNPHVFGNGITTLKNAGIEVCAIDNPDLQHKASALIKPFTKWITSKRPYIIVKIATSKDGKIAGLPLAKTKITSTQSDIIIHKLRVFVDAIMVGKNTALIDDPKLTARLVPAHRQPTRLILDTNLSCPPTLKVFDTTHAPTMVITNKNAALKNIKPFQEQNVTILLCDTHKKRLDLENVFFQLGHMGFTSILVETGPTLFNALINNNYADEIWWVTAPHSLGPQGVDIGYTHEDLIKKSYQPEKTIDLGEDLLTIFHAPSISLHESFQCQKDL